MADFVPINNGFIYTGQLYYQEGLLRMGVVSKKLIITGRVQRVGYRRFILETGQATGVGGYAKNEPDGSVSVVVQGEEENVKEFIEKIKVPPEPPLVSKVTEQESKPVPNLKYFRIKFGSYAEELQEGLGAMESQFMDYRHEFRGFHDEFRDFRQEFRDYRQEFKGFASRTDANFDKLGNKIDTLSEQTKSGFDILGNKIDTLSEQTKSGFEMLGNKIDKSSEQTGAGLKAVSDKIDAFSEQTNSNFKNLDARYGEISAKLAQILDALQRQQENYQKESQESRVELRRSVDNLSRLVDKLIEKLDSGGTARFPPGQSDQNSHGTTPPVAPSTP